MKREKLFRALADVGEDLVLMAETKRFINPWKRWGKLAACIALVLCLSVFALPYFPIGCGAGGSAKEEAPAETPAEMPAEVPAETPAETPEECPAETPAEEEATENEENIPQEVVTVWFEEIAYEIQHRAEDPEDLGELLGQVQNSDGRDLVGCNVYSALDAEGIYVETEDGIYLYGVESAYQSSNT